MAEILGQAPRLPAIQPKYSLTFLEALLTDMHMAPFI